MDEQRGSRHHLISPTVRVGQELYRGRIVSLRPSTAQELSYPPAEYTLGFQRANRPRRPMFYSCTSAHTVFYETGVSPGDLVAIGRWKTTKRLLVNNVAFHPEVHRKHQSNSINRDWANRGPNDIPESPSNAMVHRFLAEQFAQEIQPGLEYRYKISAAIAEVMIGRSVGGPHLADSLDMFASGTQFAGLLYPSLRYRCNTDNLCLTPQAVDDALILDRAWLYRIIAKKIDGAYEVECLDFADTIHADRSINWKGRPPRLIIPPGETIRVTLIDGQYQFHDGSRRPVELS
jgi:hypothetical protein